MTVRLAQAIGMDRIREMAARFGLERGWAKISPRLGSNEVTLLQLTTAYAELVNGGKRIEPALIERIQDRHGRTVLRRDRGRVRNARALPGRASRRRCCPTSVSR